ncbi:DUF4377 domain-containing protein [Idiomarina abyssalis]|uniref:DUF4377 domain-containing protein n=1 Tax=Idiomarina abyssalis TaxID=86102 RepID=UPI003A8FFD0E
MEFKTLSRSLLLAFMTAYLFGCGGSNDSDEGTEYTVTVASEPVYYGLGIQFTPPITGHGTNQSGQEIFTTSIEGFEHEFGTSYELRVLEKNVDTEGVADGSSISIELVEVISSQSDSVGTSYVYSEVELSGNPFTDKEEGVYSFYQYEFLCAENADCDALVAIADSGGLVEVEFEYTGGEIPVTLVRWN